VAVCELFEVLSWLCAPRLPLAEELLLLLVLRVPETLLLPDRLMSVEVDVLRVAEVSRLPLAEVDPPVPPRPEPEPLIEVLLYVLYVDPLDVSELETPGVVDADPETAALLLS
jgi:hypothetical protein